MSGPLLLPSVSLAQTLSDTITWQQRCFSIQILKRYRCLVGWTASMVPWARSRDASAMVRRCCMQLGMPQLPQREKHSTHECNCKRHWWKETLCCIVFKTWPFRGNAKQSWSVLCDHSVEWQDVVLRLKAENCGNGRNPHLQRIHVKMECPQNRLQETQHAVDLMWGLFCTRHKRKWPVCNYMLSEVSEWKISVLCIAVSAGVARLTRHFNLGGCFLCVGRALAGQARQFVRILVDVFCLCTVDRRRPR